MRSLGFVCSKPLDLAEVAKLYGEKSYGGKPVIASFETRVGNVGPYVRVEGAFGYFDIALNEFALDEYENSDLEFIQKHIPVPYFYAGDYGPHEKALDAAKFAVSKFPFDNGVLVHDDHGPILPIAEAKTLIKIGRLWH